MLLRHAQARAVLLPRTNERKKMHESRRDVLEEVSTKLKISERDVEYLVRCKRDHGV